MSVEIGDELDPRDVGKFNVISEGVWSTQCVPCDGR